MYLGYALTVAYSPNSFLPIALTCQNFPVYGGLKHCAADTQGQ